MFAVVFALALNECAICADYNQDDRWTCEDVCQALDINDDGIVSSGDLFTYVDAWMGDQSRDTEWVTLDIGGYPGPNGEGLCWGIVDGRVDSLDLALFLHVWETHANFPEGFCE